SRKVAFTIVKVEPGREVEEPFLILVSAAADNKVEVAVAIRVEQRATHTFERFIIFESLLARRDKATILLKKQLVGLIGRAQEYKVFGTIAINIASYHTRSFRRGCMRYQAFMVVVEIVVLLVYWNFRKDLSG